MEKIVSNMNLTSFESGMGMPSTGDHLLMVILICLICILVLLIGVCCRVAMRTSIEEDSFFSSRDTLSRDEDYESPERENLHYGTVRTSHTMMTQINLLGPRKGSHV